MKTQEEVGALKEDWLDDPCWDIEETEGYEEYHDALRCFRQKQEELWSRLEDEKLRKYAESLGTYNLRLALEMWQLCNRVKNLESVIDRILDKG